MPGRLAHPHVPTHSNSGHFVNQSQEPGTASYGEGGKTLEVSFRGGVKWNELSQKSSLGAPRVLFLVVSCSLTDCPPCSGIVANLWFLSDAVPHLPVFTDCHLTTAVPKSNPREQRKDGELQRIASESHLLVQKWKPDSRWKGNRRALLLMSFFSYLNI